MSEAQGLYVLTDANLTSHSISAASNIAPTLYIYDGQQAEVVRISADGAIFWKGREVETDEDFKAAMMDVRNYLVGVRT